MLKMCNRRLSVFVTLLCVGIALDLPPDFQKCKRSDSDFNGCLKGAIQDALPKLEKGLSEFDFPPLQPLHVPSMTTGEGTGTVQVVQNYTNLNIYDLTRGRIDNVEAKLTDAGFDTVIDLFFPQLRAQADYEFNGRVLVLPIVGKGPCVTTFKDVKARFKIHADELKKKQQSYYEIKDFKVELKLGRLLLNFMNLFDGDERLGSEMNKLLNENWSEVWEDVDDGYEETMGLIFKNISNLIFKKVSHKQLFPQ